MQQYFPFFIFGLAFVALVAWLLMKSQKERAAQARKLAQMGFSRCEGESRALVDKVTGLENNAEYRYRVENPMRASLDGKVVYFYTKARHRQGHVVTADEFLLPLKRLSQQGLMVFVKPSDVPEGTATTLIGAVATGAWDSQPDDLTKLDVPPALSGTNVIGVLGPAGTSLYDLIETDSLNLIQNVGDCGALVVVCRGDLCSLSSPSARMPIDLDKMWPLIRQLV